MRIGNLELRKSSYIGTPPEHIGWDICKWKPNQYYGRESEFIKDGDYYHPNTESYKFVSIYKSCFKYPESCYVIASWRWDGDCYILEFCGDRPIGLTDEEWITFKELLDKGFRQLNPWWYED